MIRKNWYQSLLSGVILIGITTLLYLYSAGYRLTQQQDRTIDLSKTGMISAKSIPEGSSVYLNGILLTATNDTISGIEPGTHNLKIIKKGFVTWSKDIEVFPELVTDITAVLVSQGPRLEPLTNSGARNPTISSSLTKLAYFSKDGETPGIRIIPLAGEGLSLFRSTPSSVIQDTPRIIYSNGKSIEWSPDEKNLMVESENGTFYLIDIAEGAAEVSTSPQEIKQIWQDKLNQTRQDFIQKLDIPDEIKTLAMSTKTVWSPDEKKFLYTRQNGAELEYRVYNLEKPLPVGEKVENTVFTTAAADPQPKISWYADSFHLILTEGDVNADKRGVVSLIRIDGTNKTELYNNTLMYDQVYSSPAGDKIIILTSFKSGEQTDLYTVSIR
ncbi:MAG: WD40-domain containing protein [candidate division WWE3 bacterium GW2011_GWB1_41_6]|uniref:WD40-domain containing protein n=1 Tax=candidate division WWE3 bacterium GW2011_GWB1_41_6 TaxID=1619112 RepID=A0A0G0WVF9_UNCKA|nr:MAG: WD40-domain containing protein [candidate division WWE3 bacterium GW2011_GWB1_41_6]